MGPGLRSLLQLVVFKTACTQYTSKGKLKNKYPELRVDPDSWLISSNSNFEVSYDIKHFAVKQQIKKTNNNSNNNNNKTK